MWKKQSLRTTDPPPLDPVKAYFKLLQCIHHLEILNKCLADNTCPIGMKRKVDKLASCIKPASPDYPITAIVAAHTRSWMMDNIMALRNHYADLSEALHNDLRPFHPTALEKVIKWARSRYCRKLTPSSIDTLQTLKCIVWRITP